MKEAQGTQIQRIRLFPDLTGPEYPGLAMPGLEHSGLDSPGWDVWENCRETVVCRSGLGILPDMAGLFFARYFADKQNAGMYSICITEVPENRYIAAKTITEKDAPYFL